MVALDPDGNEMAPGEVGALCARLPMPPSTTPSVWSAEERFARAYLSGFPGFYETADAGFIDEDGYVQVMARTDDIINVAGRRLLTSALEEAPASIQMSPIVRFSGLPTISRISSRWVSSSSRWVPRPGTTRSSARLSPRFRRPSARWQHSSL